MAQHLHQFSFLTDTHSFSPGVESSVDGNITQNSENRPLPPDSTSISNTYWIHFPLIITTNTLVIAAVYRVKELHTPNNMIIAGLAIADTLTGVVHLPIVWMTNNPDSDIRFLIKRTKTACLFGYFGLYMPPKVSLKYLFLTSLDRFFAIKFAVKYRNTSSLRNVSILMALVFLLDVFEFVVVSLHYLYQNIWRDGLSKLKTIEQCYAQLIFPKAYDLFLIGLTVILIITSLALNLFVGHFASKQIKVRYASIPHGEFKKRQSRAYRDIKLKESQLTQLKISLALMCVYVMLWLPFIVYLVTTTVTGDRISFTKQIMRAFTRHCLLANAWINAIVYAILKNTYRKAFFFFLTNYPWKWSRVNAFLKHDKGMMTTYTTPISTKLSSSTKRNLNNTPLPSRQLDTNQQLEQEKSGKEGGVSSKHTVDISPETREKSLPRVVRFSTNKSNASFKSVGSSIE